MCLEISLEISEAVVAMRSGGKSMARHRKKIDKKVRTWAKAAVTSVLSPREGLGLSEQTLPPAGHGEYNR